MKGKRTKQRKYPYSCSATPSYIRRHTRARTHAHTHAHTDLMSPSSTRPSALSSTDSDSTKVTGMRTSGSISGFGRCQGMNCIRCMWISHHKYRSGRNQYLCRTLIQAARQTQESVMARANVFECTPAKNTHSSHPCTHTRPIQKSTYA